MINSNHITVIRNALTRYAPQRRKRARGFSIPEFLSYSVASSLLIAASATTLITSIRSNTNMELYQRAEESWSRISALIQSEANEASSFTYGETLSCLGSIAGGGGRTIVKFEIPYLLDQAASTTRIYYSHPPNVTGSSSQLRRCGFGYSADGKLRFTDTNNTLSTVGLRTEMSVSDTATDSFTFTLNFYTPSNQLIFSRSATATAGVEPAQICNSTGTTCVN